MKTNPLRLSSSSCLQRRSQLAALLSAAVLGACQTQPDRYLGRLPGGQASDVTVAPTTPGEPFGGPRSDFAGRWTGVAENPLALDGDGDVSAFASGSTQILLELGMENSCCGDRVTGTITFGEPAALPLPDPQIGYPSDAGYERLGYFYPEASDGYFGPLPPYEGFAYRGVEGQYINESPTQLFGPSGLADGVLRFLFNTEEIIAPWCELQQPLPDGSGGFNCIKGNMRGRSDDGKCTHGFGGLSPEEEAAVLAAGVSLDVEAVDCGKAILCSDLSPRCVCDETSCRGSDLNRSQAELRLRREGDVLVGVFTNLALLNPRGLALPPGPVHFERAP